ncbi:hypothetical protein M569_16762 [Genlisea aurea]|uniref:Uncharacterized protein n=1 Tax=Genlisea aurea TaxID=192259 RepID=S8BUK5_9LAMI|nr:hypothetical protein M569_16762 [Genlisea aurea]
MGDHWSHLNQKAVSLNGEWKRSHLQGLQPQPRDQHGDFHGIPADARLRLGLTVAKRDW